MSIDGNGRKPDGKFGEGNQAARGRRTLRKTARELFKSDLSTAIGVLRELLQDSRRPEVRLQAAKLILEYSLGKPIATNLVAAANASGEPTLIDSLREELRRASEGFEVVLTTRPDDDSA